MNEAGIIHSNLIIIVPFLIALFAAGIYAGVSGLHLLLFMAIQVLGLLIPGILIVNCSGVVFKNSVSKVFAGYTVGYALVTTVYAFMLLLNIHKVCPYVLYAICLFSLLLILYKRKTFSDLFGRTNDNKILLIFFLIVLFIGFLVYQYPFRSALQIGFQDMYSDSTYWFKNCVASTKGYPLPELSVQGNNLYWHLFSCFNIAMLHFSTGIEIYDLCFSLSYVCKSFVLVGCAYVFINELISNKKLVWTGLAVLLFCSSVEPATWVYFLEHLYATTLGVADGLSLSLLAIVMSFKGLDQKRINYKIIIVTTLLFIASVGSKVPNGFMVLVCLGYFVLYDIVKYRRLKLSYCVVTVLFAVLFLIINKVYVIDGNALVSETSSHKLTLNFSTAITPTIFHFIYKLMIRIGLGNIIPTILLIVPYIITTSPIMLFFAWAVILIIKRRKELLKLETDGILFSLFATTLTGLVIFLSLGHPGFSQVYFLFGIFPITLLVSLIVIENYSVKLFFAYRKYIYGIMVLSIFCNIAIAKWTFMLNDKFFVKEERTSNSGTSISREEIVGLRWIRDNLEEEAVLVTNKVLEPNSGKHSFVTSAYSERQVYLEGYMATNLPNNHIVNDRLSEIKKYLKGDEEARESLINAGVKYVVLYKNITNEEIDKFNVLYENKDIAICKI